MAVSKKIAPRMAQVNLQIDSRTSFKQIVRQLEVALTLPKGLAPRGCAPCLSGLDQLTLDSRILDRIR